MAEYLTELTDVEVRTRAEGVAEHVTERLRVLFEQGEFISTAQEDVEDPDIKMEIYLRQRDISREIDTLRTVGGVLGIL